jgi:hypothetical protein
MKKSLHAQWPVNTVGGVQYGMHGEFAYGMYGEFTWCNFNDIT